VSQKELRSTFHQLKLLFVIGGLNLTFGTSSSHRPESSRCTGLLVSSRPTRGIASLHQTTDFYPRIHRWDIQAYLYGVVTPANWENLDFLRGFNIQSPILTKHTIFRLFFDNQTNYTVYCLPVKLQKLSGINGRTDVSFDCAVPGPRRLVSRENNAFPFQLKPQHVNSDAVRHSICSSAWKCLVLSHLPIGREHTDRRQHFAVWRSTRARTVILTLDLTDCLCRSVGKMCSVIIQW
jgi:hypothetical protein